jgi:hypothetical protein
MYYKPLPTPKFSIADIDLDKELGLYTQELKPPSMPKPQSKTARLFLKGPIPFTWLQKANSLGGSTGIVATGLWFYVGINSSKYFKVDSKLDQFTGVTRQTRQHALQKLEIAGLVKISNPKGSYPYVEILGAP